MFLDSLSDLFVAPWLEEMAPYDPSEEPMSSADFQGDGQYDPIHHCQVLGDVLSDMQHIHQQTHESCALMAQEQFVERYCGVEIPEEVLEELAETWGVYTPEGGTTFAGFDAVLDYYNVPHQSFRATDFDTLDRIITDGQDGIIGVDPRHFYNDPTIPPGSGHAVAIVGKGIDQTTGETKGYYFTDSNCPGTSHFRTLAEIDACWDGDLIAVSA
jgi:hypothetical protein